MVGQDLDRVPEGETSAAPLAAVASAEKKVSSEKKKRNTFTAAEKANILTRLKNGEQLERMDSRKTTRGGFSSTNANMATCTGGGARIMAEGADGQAWPSNLKQQAVKGGV
jgi:hypothetical protein